MSHRSFQLFWIKVLCHFLFSTKKKKFPYPKALRTCTAIISSGNFITSVFKFRSMISLKLAYIDGVRMDGVEVPLFSHLPS